MSRSWRGGSTSQWRRLRAYVLDRDGHRCQMPVRGGDGSNGGATCGAFATHVDHITPRSKGGAFLDPANCRAACAPCNLRRGAGDAPGRRRPSPPGWSW